TDAPPAAKKAKRIAKLGKSHTIAETLILPAAQDVQNNDRRLGAVPLSNDTVARRISDIVQLDESTEIAGQAQLLTYVRYLRDKSHTTGEAILDVLDIFLHENGLTWDRCVGLCTDSARAMKGHEHGLAAHVQQVAPLVKWTHCMVHRKALAAKKMPVLFDSVLNQSGKMINLIKSRPLNFRLFGVLCQEMGSGHKQLILHTEVRWLSRGRVLQWLYELREEVKYLDDTMWHASLSYLVDIFDCLNGLNLSLQGRETHILLLVDRVDAFTQKLDLWHGRITNKLSIDMQEQLIELKSDSRLKELFNSCPLSSFWAALMQEYPQLCDVALKILLPFASTYLREAGFSKMTALKTKYRNQAQIEDDLRLYADLRKTRSGLLQLLDGKCESENVNPKQVQFLIQLIQF
uniref:DUF4371 domain-containing protein n=1 Tax=Esox lucius TaxID=8010 RepID=A0AAY5KAR4_ESOLU